MQDPWLERWRGPLADRPDALAALMRLRWAVGSAPLMARHPNLGFQVLDDASLPTFLAQFSGADRAAVDRALDRCASHLRWQGYLVAPHLVREEVDVIETALVIRCTDRGRRWQRRSGNEGVGQFQ